MIRLLLAVVLLASACDAPPSPAALSVGVQPASPTTRDTVYATLDGEPVDDSDADVRWVRRRDGRTVRGAALSAAETTRYDIWDVHVVSGTTEGHAQFAVSNSAPTGFLSMPDAPNAGAPLLALAFVDDADGDPVAITWRWERDGTPTDHDGPSVPAIDLSRGQTWRAEATLRDDASATAVQGETVRIGDAPPTLEIRFDPAVPDANTGLRVDVAASDPDGDIVTTAVRWLRNGVAVAGEGDRPPLPLERGDVWSAVVTAFDGALATESQATVQVGNAAPSASAARVTPSVVRRDVAPRCEVEGTEDRDGDAVSASITWDVDGTRWSGPTLDPARYARGQSVRCLATPFDGDRAGEEVVSEPVEVANTPPSLTGATLSPASPTTEDTIAIVPTGRADADGDSVRWSATWWMDGVWLHDGLYLPAGRARRGAALTAVVTPEDGFDAGAPVTTPPVTVADAAPEIVSVTATPTPPRPDVDWMIDVTALDPDGDPWSAFATFSIDGVAQPDLGTLRLPKEALLGAREVAVTVWVTDGERSSAPWTLGPIAVGNGRPTVTTLAISPSEPTARDALQCAAVEVVDPEGDPTDVAYAWFIDGRSAYAGPVLPPGLARRGETVTCSATAGDAGGVGAPTEASVTLGNAAPMLLALQWSVDPLADGAPLDVVATLEDPDADALTLERTWSVNGATVPTDGGPLDPAWFQRGDMVSVDVRAFDGRAGSAPLSIDPTPVVNAPPTASIVLTPNPMTAATGAVAVVGVSDPDGDATTANVHWTVNGTPVADAGPVLPANALRRGDDVVATVVATDSLGATTAQVSDRVVVDNAPPTGSVHLVPERPIVGRDALRCVPEGDRDADGDGVTWTLAWTRDGAPWPALGDVTQPLSDAWTGDTVPTAAMQAGETWACAATPFDVEGPGDVAVAETSPWRPATRVLKAGGGTTCAILPDDTTRCWGDNTFGQAVAPDVVLADLAVGYDAVVGLRPDGRLLPWGDPLLVGVPADRFSQVAVGDDHACGRTLLGAARCWGFDIAGRTSPPAGTYVAVTVGLFHGCGVLADGRGVCWGDDSFGQATPPPGAWADVVAGDLDTCWRDLTGTVECRGLDASLHGPWGDGWTGVVMGSAGACLMRDDAPPICLGAGMPAGAPSVAVDAIALGVGYGCARLADDGTTTCWGEEPHGAAWPPDPVDAVVAGVGLAGRTAGIWRGFGPVQGPPPGIATVWALTSTGGVGDDQDGTPVAWGATELRPPPGVTADRGTWSGGARHVAALDGGDAVAWGVGPAVALPAPVGPWASVSAAGDHTLLLDGGGGAACWGTCTPPPPGPWALVRAGDVADCGLDAAGSVACWGGAAWRLAESGFTDLAVTRTGGCALRADGSTACFGSASLPATPYVALYGSQGGVCGWTAAGDLRCRGSFAR